MGGNILGSFVPVKKKTRNYNHLSLSKRKRTFLIKLIHVLCDLFPYMFYVVCGNTPLFRVQVAHLLLEKSKQLKEKWR